MVLIKSAHPGVITRKHNRSLTQRKELAMSTPAFAHMRSPFGPHSNRERIKSYHEMALEPDEDGEGSQHESDVGSISSQSSVSIADSGIGSEVGLSFFLFWYMLFLVVF